MGVCGQKIAQRKRQVGGGILAKLTLQDSSKTTLEKLSKWQLLVETASIWQTLQSMHLMQSMALQKSTQTS